MKILKSHEKLEKDMKLRNMDMKGIKHILKFKKMKRIKIDRILCSFSMVNI